MPNSHDQELSNARDAMADIQQIRAAAGVLEEAQISDANVRIALANHPNTGEEFAAIYIADVDDQLAAAVRSYGRALHVREEQLHTAAYFANYPRPQVPSAYIDEGGAHVAIRGLAALNAELEAFGFTFDAGGDHPDGWRNRAMERVGV